MAATVLSKATPSCSMARMVHCMRVIVSLVATVNSLNRMARCIKSLIGMRMPRHHKLVVTVIGLSWLSATSPRAPAPAAPCIAQQQHAVLQQSKMEAAGHVWTPSMG